VGGYVAADAVRTPWGNANELRARRLRPGPGASREKAVRNQRERLYAAMVASTAARGYAATTVGDLLQLAGVSRATFYEHFSDKGDCFRATVEALLEAGLGLIRTRLESPGPPNEQAEEALGGVLRLVAEQPAAARMSLVEAYAAGADGLEPINNAFESACELAHDALRRIPGRDDTPPELARAVIGGCHRLLYQHLFRGEEQALVDKLPDLWAWASGFPPAGELRPGRRQRPKPVERPPYGGRDIHERIIRAFSAVAARRGLPGVTVGQIAAEASISQATFYQHFDNKDDVLVAALDLSGAQLVAAVLPVSRREPDWPQAIRKALESVCGFLVSEPDFARLRAVEAYAAGPNAIEHRDESWRQITGELIPVEFREGPEPGPIPIEGSIGGVHALIYEKIRRGQLHALLDLPPLLTYVMLAPFIGPDGARDVARGAQPESMRRT